jgi:hypothetical protein
MVDAQNKAALGNIIKTLLTRRHTILYCCRPLLLAAARVFMSLCSVQSP